MSKTMYFYNDGRIRVYLMSLRGQSDGKTGMVFTPNKDEAYVSIGTEYRPSICAHLLQENVKDAVYVIRFTTIEEPDYVWYLHKALNKGGTSGDRQWRAEFGSRKIAADNLHHVYHFENTDCRSDIDKVWIEKVEI